MATLKINYNGTIYSMVKTSSKITTPSVAVDGGWIPCFKGDRFAEVTYGDQIYTLSPLMVNGYRMACGSRTAFTGHVFITVHQVSIRNNQGMYVYDAEIKNVYTNQTGFSASVNVTSSDTGPSLSVGGISTQASYTYKFAGTYTVTKSSTGTVIKTGNFNVSVNHVHTFPIGVREEKDYNVQIA